MKKVKTYRNIKSVEMANEHVYAIAFWEKDEVLDSLEVFKTKDDALKYAERVRTFGSGKYSGLHLWQLPQKITREIKRLLGDRYSSFCEE
jgi:hypothetical protein